MEGRDFPPAVGEDFSTRVPSRATVWIVEDSPLQLNEMRRLLAGDYDMGAFDSAEEMLERLSHGAPPDVLLLDSQLGGGISGLDACRFVRSNFDEVTLPILLVTAFQAPQDPPERWVESRAQVAFDEHGQALRIAAVMVDGGHVPAPRASVRDVS